MELVIGVVPVRQILTKSKLPGADYAVNPYVGCTHACRYCFASFMARHSVHGGPWGSFVDVKYWEPVKRPGAYAGKRILLSSVTDPYQPAEAKYRRTRAFLESMQGSGCRLSILTKSDLVLRDLDLIRTFSGAEVTWSVNTLDEAFRRDMDRAVSIERRLAAMRTFHEAGVVTGCFIAPVFPGITDVRAIIRRVRDRCRCIEVDGLNLRGPYARTIFAYIAARRPALLPLYEDIYRKGNGAYWAHLREELAAIAAEEGLPFAEGGSPRPRWDGVPAVVSYL